MKTESSQLWNPIHHKNLPYTTPPNLSKLCGKIIYIIFVLGNITQLKARNLHKIIQVELTWDKRIRLHENNKANQAIIFWRNNLMRLSSCQCFCILHPYQFPTVFISSDASYHALPAQFFKGGREQICLTFFRKYKIKLSSTWRKSFAIQFALKSFTPKGSNKTACWKTDNYAASLIMEAIRKSELKVIRHTGN